MIKLLRADFARLWKTKSFWICVGVAFAVCFSNLLLEYAAKPAVVLRLGKLLIQGTSTLVLIAAVFSAIFIGTDYSCGTIRNKITIGRRRSEIYLSNFIVTTTGALIMSAVIWIGESLFGLFTHGELGMPAGKFAGMMAVNVFVMIAFCAIFTFIGMNIASKSSGIVVSIGVSILVILCGGMIADWLNQPEIRSDYYIENGELKTSEYPNPMYVSGTLRDILTVLDEALPGGQVVRLESGEGSPGLMPLYSVGVTAAVTAVGLAVFRRKDLK